MTQTGGILKPFAIFIGWIMEGIYNFLSGMGIVNIGLCIILLTVVVNLILAPVTYRQQKFSRMSQIMNPEIRRIQKKYANKRDEKSMRLMQAETSAVYDKYGVSPTGGCITAIVQIPILFALYRVIYNIPAYVKPVKQVYENIAKPIMSADTDGSIMNNLISTLGLKVTDFDITNTNKVIDALYLIKSTSWDTVRDAFSSFGNVVDAINTYSAKIISMNTLPLGLTVSDNPINIHGGLAGWFPGILIPILAGLTQWINIRVNQRYTKAVKDNSSDQGQMGESMKMMNNFMPFMSIFFCATLPAGIGVYWISSATVRIFITLIIDAILSKRSIEDIIEANKEKAAKKAEKRKEQVEKLDKYASMNTKTSYRQRSVSDIARNTVKEDTPSIPAKKTSAKSASAAKKTADGKSAAAVDSASAGTAGGNSSSAAASKNEKKSGSGKKKSRKQRKQETANEQQDHSISKYANMLNNSQQRRKKK